MGGRWRKSFGLWALLYAVFWILNGWPEDGVRDSMVDRMINGGDTDEEGDYEGGRKRMRGYEELIADVKFKATVEMGVRKRSNVVGQIFDYMRLNGKWWIWWWSNVLYRSNCSHFS